MTETLRVRYPVAVGSAVDAADVRRIASLAASERQAELVSDPWFVEAIVDPRFPGFVSHIFECETTAPVLDSHL